MIAAESLIAQLEALALPDLAHHAMSLALGYGVTGADREKREFTAASDALLERIRTATARAEALERENERLREALRPFGEVADAIFHKFDDGAIANAGKADDRAVWGFNNAEVTYGDFRRARQALEAK